MYNAMSPLTKKIAARIGIGLLAGVLGYICLILLTPTFGTITGYANQQPALQVQQPSNASPAEEVQRMLSLAKLHFDNTRDLDQLYWPEPSLIEEHADCWLVSFTRKVPVYRFLGVHQTVPPTDLAMFISITKSNYAARFGKWCQ